MPNMKWPGSGRTLTGPGSLVEGEQPEGTAHQGPRQDVLRINRSTFERTTLPSALAIHEAGHAVIGRVVRGVVGGVTIIGDDEHEAGHAVADQPRLYWERGDGPKRVLAEGYCISCYAGAEAERIILGISASGLDCHDIALAEIHITWGGLARGAVFVGDDAYDRCEERLRRRTRLLVSTHRDAIIAVAEALEARKTLTRAEVDGIVASGRAA